MKLFRKWLAFYIDASVHVAAAVTSLVWITATELHLSTDWNLLGFVFFGTITGYNFVKYASRAGLRHKSLTASLKAIQIFSLISMAIAVYFTLQLSPRTWYMAGLFGVLTFFYAVPFFPAFRKSPAGSLSGANLRTLSGLKIFVVGLVWAGVSVLVPWAATTAPFSGELWFTFIQRFLLVVVWTIPFEIRDLTYDQGSLRTLPQQLGIKRAKGVGLLLLIIALVLEILKGATGSAHFLGFIVLFFGTAYALVLSKKEQSRYFASFWVESIPIMWMFIFLFLKSYLETS